MKIYSKKVIFLFLLPSLIGVFLFKIVTLIMAFGISFTKWNLLSPPQFVGFQNYIKIFQDPNFYLALKNTMIYIAVYLPLTIIISLYLAVVLNRKLKGTTFFRAIYFLPVISSWVAISLIFKGLFNTQTGMINQILITIGVHHPPSWLQDPHTAIYAIAIASIWKNIGFNTVIFLGGLQAISKDYYEAAYIDGANSWSQFKSITVPLLSPTTYYVLVISIINSFQVFDQVNVMTAKEPSAESTPVLVTEIYKYSIKYSEMGYATALAMILLVIILLVTLITNLVQKRWVHYEN